MNSSLVIDLVNKLATDEDQIKNWHIHKGNFLDDFYRVENKFQTFSDEEPPAHNNVPKELYAWIAGMVHYLSNKNNLNIPRWTFNAKYFLDEPFFGFNPPKGKLRALMLLNSPPEMRIRNIFTLPSTFTRV